MSGWFQNVGVSISSVCQLFDPHLLCSPQVEMSTWDIAGIVLAALPLVFEGLDAYPDSALVKFAKANQERAELARHLKSVQVHLRYAMEQLFARLDAQLTIEQWQALRAPDVKGSAFFDIWNGIVKTDPKLLHTNTLADVKDVLDEMKSILCKIVENTAIPHDAGSDVLKGIIENHQKDKTFSIKEGLFRRFIFVKSSYRRGRLIQRLNQNLDVLRLLNKEAELMKLIAPPPNELEELKSHREFLDKVHDYCENLYHALSSTWQCDCHQKPSAMLRLENRKDLEARESEPIRFSLFLTFSKSCSLPDNQESWAFQETEVCIDER